MRKLLHQAALASLKRVRDSGMAGDARWGQVQQASDGTPVPGGPQALGVYNAIYSVPHGQGKRLVVSGTSYLQLVSFTDKGRRPVGCWRFPSRVKRLRCMPVTRPRRLRPGNWR